MKRIAKLLQIVLLFMLLPFEISKGAKKSSYLKIKKKMIAANLI